MRAAFGSGAQRRPHVDAAAQSRRRHRNHHPRSESPSRVWLRLGESVTRTHDAGGRRGGTVTTTVTISRAPRHCEAQPWPAQWRSTWRRHLRPSRTSRTRILPDSEALLAHGFAELSRGTRHGRGPTYPRQVTKKAHRPKAQRPMALKKLRAAPQGRRHSASEIAQDRIRTGNHTLASSPS